MKNRILFILLVAVMAISCAQRQTEVEIIPIQDNVAPRLMSRGLFADAPDSLFEALSLQDGAAPRPTPLPCKRLPTH